MTSEGLEREALALVADSRRRAPGSISCSTRARHPRRQGLERASARSRGQLGQWPAHQ